MPFKTLSTPLLRYEHRHPVMPALSLLNSIHACYMVTNPYNIVHGRGISLVSTVGGRGLAWPWALGG